MSRLKIYTSKHFSFNYLLSSSLEDHVGDVEEIDFDYIMEYAKKSTQLKISLEAVVKLFNINTNLGKEMTPRFIDGNHYGYIITYLDRNEKKNLIMEYSDDEVSHNGYFHVHRLEFLSYSNYKQKLNYV